MSIKDLIAAAYNKDATAFESAFQSVMQDKVSAAVENAFTTEETEEDLDEEVEELDEAMSLDKVTKVHADSGAEGFAKDYVKSKKGDYAEIKEIGEDC